MIAAAASSARPLIVFQNRRWDGDFLTVRKLLREGALGDVHRFESTFERWSPELGTRWQDTTTTRQGAGIVFDLGSHLVDQALVLFGPVRQVYAELDVRRPGATVDDDSFVALTHVTGVRSHLWMSSVAAQPAPRLRVLGDRAAYVKYGMDVQEEALHQGLRPGDPGWGEEPEEHWGLLGAGDHVERIRTEPGAYERFYEGVAAAIRDGSPRPVDPEDAVSALEVLDAARASAREGKVVAI